MNHENQLHVEKSIKENIFDQENQFEREKKSIKETIFDQENQLDKEQKKSRKPTFDQENQLEQRFFISKKPLHDQENQLEQGQSRWLLPHSRSPRQHRTQFASFPIFALSQECL